MIAHRSELDEYLTIYIAGAMVMDVSERLYTSGVA
jgi:hypothetical protein